MHVLWIATKVPVPPVDGGRLVQLLTLRALARRGVRVTLLAPLFPGEDQGRLYRAAADFCEPRLVPVEALAGGLLEAGRWRAALGRGALPLPLARHAHRRLRQRARELIASGRFSLVHAEQLQALPQAEAALEEGLPVVLRAQNVESDLWTAAADRVPWPARAAALGEARRLARWEGEAVARVARAVALTTPDARRLAELAAVAGRPVAVEGTGPAGAGPGGMDGEGGEGGEERTPALAAAGAAEVSATDGAVAPAAAGAAPGGRRLVVVPAPFPAELPAGPEALPGGPALVVLGSGGWLPNRDARSWMEEAVWPAVRRRVPAARLHLFGGGDGEAMEGPERRGGGEDGDGITRHPPPEDAARAFAPGSVLVVPLRIASGVRMKILEAWARGVAVVATPEAAAGLGAVDGRELLVAADGAGIAAAVARLAAEPELAGRLVSGGRALLARHHDPERVAERLEAVYREVARPVGRERDRRRPPGGSRDPAPGDGREPR